MIYSLVFIVSEYILININEAIDSKIKNMVIVKIEK